MTKPLWTQLLAYLFLATAGVTLQILVFTRGWGLTPQNWWWIIGGGIFGFAVLQTFRDKIEREATNAAS